MLFYKNYFLYMALFSILKWVRFWHNAFLLAESDPYKDLNLLFKVKSGDEKLSMSIRTSSKMEDIKAQSCCNLSYELENTRMGSYGGEIFPDSMIIAEALKKVRGNRLYLYVDSEVSI